MTGKPIEEISSQTSIEDTYKSDSTNRKRITRNHKKWIRPIFRKQPMSTMFSVSKVTELKSERISV